MQDLCTMARSTSGIASGAWSSTIVSVFLIITVPSSTFADTICDGRVDGLYAHPQSCQGYIHCFRNEAHSQRCTPGLYFNEAIQSCDYQQNVNCKESFEPDVPARQPSESVDNRNILTSDPALQPNARQPLPVESNDVIHGITEENIRKLQESIVTSSREGDLREEEFLSREESFSSPPQDREPSRSFNREPPNPSLQPLGPPGGDKLNQIRSIPGLGNENLDAIRDGSGAPFNIQLAKKFAPAALVDAQDHLRQRLRDEAAIVIRMRGVIDSFSFQYVNAFLGAKPYAKYLSHSGNTLLETSRIIQKRYSIAANDIIAVMRQVPTSNMIIPLPEPGRPNTPFPIPPDIGYCPYPLTYICDPSNKYRSADGTCNNLRNPIIGRAMTPFARFLPAAYGNGIDTLRHSVLGGALPGARHVSLSLFPDVDRRHFLHSLMLMSFGQFLDHDITRTAITKNSKEEGGFGETEEVKCGFNGCEVGKPGLEACLPIEIPKDDPDFKSSPCLKFVRSQEVASIDCKFSTREQLNQLTSWVDASNVYGSTIEEQNDLRDLSDRRRGRMATHPHPYNRNYKDLLPQDEVDLCRGTNSTVKCFKAGDERVNEQASLTAVHTIWIREHNRIEKRLHRVNPQWRGEKLFQETRRIVSAMMQHIVYNEFLPVLLGQDLLARFGLNLQEQGYFFGYDAGVNGGVAQAFATAAFRLHTLVDERLGRTNEKYEDDDSLFLSNAFRRPKTLYDISSGGMDSHLRGLCEHTCQSNDPFFTKQISRSLFTEQPPFGPGMDLLALNIQRARDHGVPGYNAYREFCGLGRARTFDDLAKEMPNEVSRRALEKVYKHVDDIDLFAGGVSERSVRGGIVGPTFGCIIAKQFEALRKGDRFWYENKQASFTPDQLNEIRKSRLGRVVCANSDTMATVQPYVMLKVFREAFNGISRENYDETRTGMPYSQFEALYKENFNDRVTCDSLPEPDLTKWAAR